MLAPLSEPDTGGIAMARGSRRGAVVLVMFAVVAALLASGPSGKASGAAPATFAGTAGTVTRASAAQFGTKAAVRQTALAVRRGPSVGPTAGHRGANISSSHQSGPQAADAGLGNNKPALAHNFTGLNSVDSFNANGFILEPPDQGLCAGTLLGSSVVVEIINDVIGLYTPNGTLVGSALDLNTFFGESLALNVSDPRCIFDPTTQTWFFSAVIYTNTLFPNHTDVLVLKGGSGAEAVYAVDTTLPGNTTGECPCFGDQPKLGIDKNNVYISVDQFNSPNTALETGADLFALSKSQLVAEKSSVNFAQFLNLALAGLGVTGLQPAITTGNSNIEYLLNAFPYQDEAQLQPNTISDQLGLWALSDTDVVSHGGVPKLSATMITSETYGFPVPALTTNGLSLATFTLDSRMQQVQFINGEIWGALSSAVAVGHDPVTRDGVAWFEIDPKVNGNGHVSGGTFTDQGYVAAAGKYLVYPAIATTLGGSTGIAFSITSPTLNPSTGYVLRKAGDAKFDGIHLTDTGSGPDIGFTCALGFPQQCRWGDYSWAALDPSGSGLWMAAELTVAQVATQPGITPPAQTNWGTQVWEVNAP